MSRSVKVRGEYRARWDMEHDSEVEYSRSRIKRETEECLQELSGSAEEDLKPFWEEVEEKDAESYREQQTGE
ncbi:MAG: hypothetical protein Q8P81_03210 [Nanoarchaeota archaeon]|nr:hypothetical protein [Nanoarchaeota archaeon]